MKIQPLEFEKPIVELEEKLADLKRHSRANDINFDSEVRRMEQKLEETKLRIYQNLSAWERVQIARHPARPFAQDYIQLSFSGFIELHGDRLFGDDAAMPGGLATVGRHRALVVGHQKGRDTKENLKRNFGSAHPEGYRKALRLMRLAEKFGLAFVSLIDTPGAFPGSRRGGAAYFGGDRGESARDDGAAGADRRGGDRRRRLGRRARDRRGGSRADAGKRLLLGDLAGGVRGDFVEAPEARAGGRRGAEADRARSAGAEADR